MYYNYFINCYIQFIPYFLMLGGAIMKVYGKAKKADSKVIPYIWYDGTDMCW